MTSMNPELTPTPRALERIRKLSAPWCARVRQRVDRLATRVFDEPATAADGRRSDLLVALTCGVLSTGAAYDLHPQGLVSGLAANAALGWAAAAALLLRRRLPELVTVLALAESAGSGDRAPLIFASYALAVYGRRSPWLWATVLVLGYITVDQALLPDLDRPPGYRASGAIVVPFVLGLVVRRHRTAMAALRERASQARSTVGRAVEFALLEERTRIAQHTHDELGHRLTVLTLQAAALRLKAEPGSELAQRAEAIEDTARGTMSDVRSMLDMLQGPAGRESGVSRLDFPRFVESLARNMRFAGMEVETEIEEPGRELTASEVAVLRKVVGEGLTNAAKHAAGARVTISLAHRDGMLELQVANGPARQPRQLWDSGGLGLRGMRAAATDAGGDLSCGPTAAGGYRLRLRLPEPAPAPAAAAPL
ncbi:sensor histidine kinase [Streptomyces monticola]|uniref:histidine kinase n=1 Tax=Streptomyces monticola TaxID=2666263 RepID=A0ABW2JTI6_9ACTN